MLFRNILVNSFLSLSSYNYLETYCVYQFTTHLEEYWRGMECGGNYTQKQGWDLRLISYNHLLNKSNCDYAIL